MYTGPQAGAQRALEVICIVLLAVFAAGDAWHALALARKSRFGELLGFGALLDWGHWALMAYAWWMWYANVTEVAGFTMMTQPDYWVLNQKAHRAARCVASGEAGRAASRAASPKRMRGRQPTS